MTRGTTVYDDWLTGVSQATASLTGVTPTHGSVLTVWKDVEAGSFGNQRGRAINAQVYDAVVLGLRASPPPPGPPSGYRHPVLGGREAAASAAVGEMPMFVWALIWGAVIVALGSVTWQVSRNG